MLNKWLKVIFYPSGGGEALLQGFQASFEGGHAPLSTWGHLSCRGALLAWPEFLKLDAHRPDPEVAEQLSAVPSLQVSQHALVPSTPPALPQRAPPIKPFEGALRFLPRLTGNTS